MKKSKIILAAVLAAATALTGCSSKEESSASSSASESVTSTAASTAESSAAEDSDSSAASDVSTAESAATAEADEENYNTGDASLDNPRNQDEIGDNELLVLSFGTSFNDSRRLTIGAIENDLETAFPGYSVRRGFTANIVIDHVYKRDGEKIDDIGESLDRAVANGVKNLVVQPTHLMNGIEYDELCGKIAVIPTRSRRWSSAIRCSPPTRISRSLPTLSLTGQRITMTAKLLSCSWVTAPRLNPTQYTRRCRIC